MNPKKHLFDNPKNVKLLVRILFGCCIVLFALDLVIHRHTIHPWESFTGFYALYGFFACVILVMLARELRKQVMRDEDYYEQEIPVFRLRTRDEKRRGDRRQGDRRRGERRQQGDRRNR